MASFRYKRRIRRSNIKIVEAPVRALIPASLPPGILIDPSWSLSQKFSPALFCYLQHHCRHEYDHAHQVQSWVHPPHHWWGEQRMARGDPRWRAAMEGGLCHMHHLTIFDTVEEHFAFAGFTNGKRQQCQLILSLIEAYHGSPRILEPPCSTFEM